MSAVSDFAAKVKTHQDKIDAAVDGITADHQALVDQIAKLQSTQGALTPEDQTLLDDIEAKAAAVADKLGALDDLTPPTPPTT